MNGIFGGSMRTELLAGAAIVCVATATPAYAQTRNFNVPEQDAATGIGQFARQADLQLLISARDARGRRTNRVRGAMSVQDGLRHLLEGTGLRAEPTGASTYSVVAVSGEVEAGGAAADSESAENQEIVVTGTNIRGSANPTAPLTRIDRAAIEAGGFSNTQQVIQSLPANFGGDIAEDNIGSGSGNSNLNFSGGAGANLRGLGADSTLVLLNGRRLAPSGRGAFVDLSMLPLAAVSRIDVLTDGASAVYGADAVGGVINIQTRRDFEGSETRLRYGGATQGGADELSLNQLLGARWGTGSIIAAYSFYDRDGLRADERDFSAAALPNFSLLPDQQRHTGLLSLHQDFSQAVGIQVDTILSRREAKINSALAGIFPDSLESDNQQFAISGQLLARFSDDWDATLAGVYSRSDTDSVQVNQFIPFPNVSDERYGLQTLEANVNGILFELPGGPVRMAFGGGYRHERLAIDAAAGPLIFNIPTSSRSIWSAFGETTVPLVGEANARPGIQELLLSLAGRFESYNDFGESFNPRIGAFWRATPNIAVRGSWGTSFKAPSLLQLNEYNRTNILSNYPNASAPGGTTRVLRLGGGNAALSEETARTWSIGATFNPVGRRGPTIEVGYFRISFRDRILSFSPATTVLNTNQFADIVLLRGEVPDSEFNALLAQYLSTRPANGFIGCALPLTPTGACPEPVSAIGAIIDERLLNVARVTVEGIDLRIDQNFTLGPGTLNLAANATVLTRFDRKQRPTSATDELLDTFGNPVDFRFRTGASYSSPRFSASLFVNHTDGYEDRRTTTVVPVDSWTTVDARIAYRIPLSDAATHRALELALIGTNVFDSDPPFVATTSQRLNYDQVNADPLGRYIAVEASLRW